MAVLARPRGDGRAGPRFVRYPPWADRRRAAIRHGGAHLDRRHHPTLHDAAHRRAGRHRAPSLQQVLGLGLAAAGVALALWQDAAAGPDAWRGDALALFGSLLGGAAAVFAVPYVRRYPPLVAVAVGVLPAVVFLWCGTVFAGAAAFTTTLSATGWFAMLWLGLVSAVGAYLLFHWALRHTTPTLVSMSITLNPVTAMVLVAALLEEPETIGLVGGLAAVVTGIVVANLHRRR